MRSRAYLRGVLSALRALDVHAQARERLADEPRELQLELLHAARDAHRPRLVAEVALDLAEDRGGGIGREADLAREVEAVDRLHDPDAGDLHEVVERLAAARVAAGQGPRQRQHLL